MSQLDHATVLHFRAANNTAPKEELCPDATKSKRSRRRGLSEADLRRALRVARELDPMAIIEITKDISIRIIPSDDLLC